ncbi:hypothetical protein SAMN02745945_01744 [Peptoclostridium litorale DSM 5388]|uniref:Uncharacterized protein n=1 Tax=Peptoclostridium litorale DSM 5388 TaxID=1121324 RepID=A0A069RG13_PEPLI|nr:hypothetical protein [Peptoclostridium litorale]KDR95984.1 hypothetical protein CLIT_8c01530 [Peptoclostridium litorale DSM 5388]SIO08695.1 hypothetical protein SAMN02745945_01744 [Peptoclostridium litorale DSM 5388]
MLKKWSNRDWFWLCGVLILGWIVSLSIKLADNGEIINLISLVGSGVSIALAVVAIIYAFNQSTQSNIQNKSFETMIRGIENELIRVNSTKHELIKLENDADKKESEDLSKVLALIEKKELEPAKKALGNIESEKEIREQRRKELIDKIDKMDESFFLKTSLTATPMQFENLAKGLAKAAELLEGMNEEQRKSFFMKYNDRV